MALSIHHHTATFPFKYQVHQLLLSLQVSKLLSLLFKFLLTNLYFVHLRFFKLVAS